MTASRIKFTFGWLLDARTDVVCFFLPVLAGWAFYLLTQDAVIQSSALWFFLILHGLGLGPFHQGISWSHFCDPTIRQHLIGSGMRMLRVVFVVFAIAAFCTIGMLVIPAVVLAVYLVWTFQHLLQQNTGILLLYHNHGKEALPDKSTEVSCLHKAAWCCASLSVARLGTPDGWQHDVLIAVALVFLLQFLVCARRYLLEIRAQARLGLPINLAALMFWTLSVAFFCPFAFLGRAYNDALLMSLVIHWFQYIGLNWVLVSRKGKRTESRTLAKTSLGARFLKVSVVCAVVILAIGAVGHVTLVNDSVAQKLCFGLLVSISMLHYLQDAFLWRLRDPVTREAILPFLKPSSITAAPKTGNELVSVR